MCLGVILILSTALVAVGIGDGPFRSSSSDEVSPEKST